MMQLNLINGESDMENIRIEFKHRNAINFYNLKGDLVYFLSLPPSNEGCDIITLTPINGYIFNFDGLVILTTYDNRELYYKGELLAQSESRYESFARTVEKLEGRNCAPF